MGLGEQMRDQYGRIIEVGDTVKVREPNSTGIVMQLDGGNPHWPDTIIVENVYGLQRYTPDSVVVIQTGTAAARLR
jgi:hypothetical protein